MKNNRRRLLILIQRFELAKTLQQGLKNINETSTLLITPPTEDEKNIVTAFNHNETKVSFYDVYI